jgi:putative heme-binding domain-containing protein
VLAFNTPQLNDGAETAKMSQLDAFAAIGLYEKPVAVENRPRLADPRDRPADLDARARAYLQVNCAHCHRMHAGSSVLSKMHYDLPLEKTDMVGVRPTQGTFGIHAAQVIAAGDPFRSVLWYRMAKLGGGRMPHIGSTEVDRTGLELICDWVRQIPQEKSAESGTNEAAAKLRQVEATVFERLATTHTAGERAELIDRLLSTTSGALMLVDAIDRRSLSAEATVLIVEKGSRSDEVSVRDLFERFLPPEKRVKRLGSAVRPEQILAIEGDAARGRQVFLATAGVQCKNCHRVADEGRELGPELTTIGKRLDRAQLLESILEPSKRIDPKYVTYLAETDDGMQVTGLLVHKSADEVVLKDAQNREVRIPAGRIEQLVPQGQSMMPELLLRDMTAQQVADLLEYLSGLK